MYAKNQRIPQKEIARIARVGKRVQSDYFDIRVWFDDKEKSNKYAIAVSKRIDKKAVVRNTIKRRFRAALYGLEKENKLKRGSYLIIIRSPEIRNIKSQGILDIIMKTLV